jgi:nitrite reductase (NADH) large subunit
MQRQVETYRCEWTEVVNNPERRKFFRQFVNSEETETGIEIVTERGQHRPADWPKEGNLVQIAGLPAAKPPATNGKRHVEEIKPQWVKVGVVDDFPIDGGAAIKYGKVQIAVFNFSSRGEWYACQNMCPHKRAFVLSRGIIGTQGETPKVACPLHKKTFSLASGECLSGDDMSVKVFPIKVSDGEVFLLLPRIEQLDALLATDLHCITSCGDHHACESNDWAKHEAPIPLSL